MVESTIGNASFICVFVFVLFWLFFWQTTVQNINIFPITILMWIIGENLSENMCNFTVLCNHITQHGACSMSIQTVKIVKTLRLKVETSRISVYLVHRLIHLLTISCATNLLRYTQERYIAVKQTIFIYQSTNNYEQMQVSQYHTTASANHTIL